MLVVQSLQYSKFEIPKATMIKRMEVPGRFCFVDR